MGVLAGFTLLSDPTLLGTVESTAYKDFPDRLLVVSRKYHLCVVGSDLTRTMQPVAKTGTNPLLDKYMAGFEGSGITVDQRGVRILSSSKQIPAAGWFIRVGLPTQMAFAPVSSMKRWAYLITIGLSILSSLLVWLTIRQALRPLYTATSLISDITEERMPLQNIPVTRHDEVGQLLTSFNAHLTYRKLAEESLMESEIKFRSITNTAQDAIILMNNEGRISYWNPAAEQMFGYSEEEAMGQMLHRFIAPQEHHEAYQLGFEQYKKSGSGGVIGKTVELEALRKNGSRFFIEISTSPMQIRKQWHAVGIIRDITKRKQAEDALLQSEDFLYSIIENIPAMIFVKDAAELKFVRLNRAGEELLGYSREDLIGKNDYDFFPKNEADFFTCKDMEVLDSRKLLDIPEESIHTRLLGQRMLHTKKIPILDKDGTPLYLLGISYDITDLKKAESLVRELGQRHLLATQSAKLGVWDWDIATNNMRWDDRMLELYGLTRESFPGRVEAWQKGLHPEDRERAIEDYQAALRGEREFDTEFRVEHPDGTVKQIKAEGMVIRNLEGEAVRMLGVNRDITEAKQAEESISRLANIVESSDDAIIGKTLDGIITSWNSGAERLYGYRKEEAIGRHISFLVPPGQIDDTASLLQDAMDSKIVQHYETVRSKKDGDIIEVSLTISPVNDYRGKIIGVSVIGRDVTEQKKAQALLRNLSFTDGLTGLANRRAFDTFFDRELRRAQRSKYHLSLMMIDVDFFKKFNDRYGHLIGDECLKAVASILKKAARRPGDIAARFGGEEFVVVLSMTDAVNSVRVAERIRLEVEALNIPHESSKTCGHVTISIGLVSAMPDQNISSADFINYADRALYKAKKDGRNRTSFVEDFSDSEQSYPQPFI